MLFNFLEYFQNEETTSKTFFICYQITTIITESYYLSANMYVNMIFNHMYYSIKRVN